MWGGSQPIYRKVRDIVVEMILDGMIKEGDSLPSVRALAAEFRVNHLTVLKGYHELVNEGLAEPKRGRGMFIVAGARGSLLKSERDKFLNEEWPRVRTRMDRLSIRPLELLGDSTSGASAEPPANTENSNDSEEES
jgi:GntR family transcriptional regulator